MKKTFDKGQLVALGLFVAADVVSYLIFRLLYTDPFFQVLTGFLDQNTALSSGTVALGLSALIGGALFSRSLLKAADEHLRGEVYQLAYAAMIFSFLLFSVIAIALAEGSFNTMMWSFWFIVHFFYGLIPSVLMGLVFSEAILLFSRFRNKEGQTP